MTDNKIIHIKVPSNKKKFFKICDCAKQFHTSSYYYEHKKKCEAVLANELPSQTGNFTCLEKNCTFKAKFSNIFMDHMKTVHKVQYREVCKTFQTYSEFKDWMKTFEKETKSSFLLRNKRKTEEGTMEYFRCSRSGKYCPQGLIPRKRALKSQGSKKIGFNCPAIIRVFIETQPEKVTAAINAFHYGHENNLCDITIPKKSSVKKGKATTTTNEIRKFHDAASGLSASLLHKISSSVWQMKSEKSIDAETINMTDDLCYKIEKLPPCRSDCKIKCQQCNICPHSYTCTCPDGLTGTVICKHMHFIAQKEETAAVDIICDVDINATLQDDNNECNNIEVIYMQDSENSSCESETSEKILGSTNLDDDIEVIKKNILEKNTLMFQQIKNCTDRNLLLQTRWHMDNIYNMLVLSCQQAYGKK